MAWNDDSWRDSYDAWKLASPDDEHPYPEKCDHPNEDIDVFEGLAFCPDCGERQVILGVPTQGGYLE